MIQTHFTEIHKLVIIINHIKHNHNNIDYSKKKLLI